MARHILIADDQPKVRRALRLLLEQELEANVVGEAAEAKDLLAQVAAGCPDLVLLDWGLPGMAAEDLLVALREACPALAVIIRFFNIHMQPWIMPAAKPPNKTILARTTISNITITSFAQK